MIERKVERIDLNNYPDSANHSFTAKIEKAETDAERYVRLFKEVVSFLLGTAIIIFVAWFCYETILNGNPDEKKWAMSVVSAMFGGVMTHVLKK